MSITLSLFQKHAYYVMSIFIYIAYNTLTVFINKYITVCIFTLWL